jgi:tRNA nucleotidyltransferase (CCA-adding enzyme)
MKIYLVGGAVRDELMGFESKDLDYVVVGASEQDMIDLGYKKVGADFPVFIDENGDQYALARKERKIGNGYHGFDVRYDSSVTLTEDLSRRDLTINAIAKDIETGEIVDPFDGVSDIRNKVLRHIGPAFSEDPLRVIRLARFYSRWPNFSIDDDTFELCKELVSVGKLNELTDERLFAETEKMFCQAKITHNFFEFLHQLGALTNVKFFVDLLGSYSTSQIYDIRSALSAVNCKKDAFLFFTTCIAAKNNAEYKSIAIPNRFKKLKANLQVLRDMQLTAENLLNFFLNNRAFDVKCAHINDVINSLEMFNNWGFFYCITARNLEQILYCVRRVVASDYLHLNGPEIGKAMNVERLEIINKLLGVK